jgi:uncharacterized coiled-coil DUF342 family protein
MKGRRIPQPDFALMLRGEKFPINYHLFAVWCRIFRCKLPEVWGGAYEVSTNVSPSYFQEFIDYVNGSDNRHFSRENIHFLFLLFQEFECDDFLEEAKEFLRDRPDVEEWISRLERSEEEGNEGDVSFYETLLASDVESFLRSLTVRRKVSNLAVSCIFRILERFRQENKTVNQKLLYDFICHEIKVRPEAEVLLEFIDFNEIPVSVFAALLHNETLRDFHFPISQVSFVRKLYDEMEVLKNCSENSSLRCEKFSKENQELREEYLKKSKECSELKALTEMMQLQNRQLQDKIDEVDEQLQNDQDLSQELSDANAKLVEHSEELAKQVDGYKASNDELNREVSQMHAKCTALEQIVEESERKVSHVEESNKNLYHELRKTNERLSNTNAKSMERSNEIAKQVQSCRASNDDLRLAFDEMKAEVDGLNLNGRSLEEMINSAVTQALSRQNQGGRSVSDNSWQWTPKTSSKGSEKKWNKRSEGPSFRIFVIGIDKKEHEITVRGGDSITEVKRKICENEGTSVERQSLWFNDEELKNEKTVAECGIGNSSRIWISLSFS